MGVNYGLDKVRFMNPTIVGSLLRGRVQLVSSEEIQNGIKYKMKITFELKDKEKPRSENCFWLRCKKLCLIFFRYDIPNQ